MQVAAGSQVIAFNSAGIAVVQGWVNEPATNFGLIAANITMDDGLAYNSNNTSTTTNRPRLAITYRTGGLVTATPTPSLTASPASPP